MPYLAVMNDCVSQSDLQEMGRAYLEEFEQRISGVPEDLCAPFHDGASRLEANLFSLYRTTVICVRKEPDIECVAQRWSDMVQICDSFLAKLRALHEKHPSCGAELYYDRALDLKNKCQRLLEMHR